jgi:hypothetical protein
MDAATWCRHLVPQGSVYAFLADHRHQLFPPELFADVARQGGGHPSVPAEVIATVMVLQALEGLSDREAVSALRLDIAWKVACGLRLDDEGFHPTVLVYWRARLRASEWPRRIFEAVRQVVEATGVLKGRGRRVLDSTILEDAVATQDTVTQLVAAIRRVRRLVPPARQVELAAHDYDRPGKPDCAWDDPEARQALVSGLVNDALAVLAAVGEVELDAEQAEAVALLALVAGQDVEPGERPGSWRIARRVAQDRVISVVDPQARHARKSSAHKRDGYKGHLAAEPESGLVTECALTAANVAMDPPGSGCWLVSSRGLRCWEIRPTAVGRPARRCVPPATSRRSSRSHSRARCRAGSPSTTSASTGMAAWFGARRASRRRSPARAGSASRASVGPARYVGAAPPQGRAASFTCTRTRTSCAPPAAARPPGASSTATGAGGRWWNARSPGWSPMAAGGCPTAASPATSCGGQSGSPRSICAGCWRSALPARMPPGSWPEPDHLPAVCARAAPTGHRESSRSAGCRASPKLPP